MPHHVEHFEPVCPSCLLEAADVLLLALLIALLVASVKHRLGGGGPGASSESH